MTPWGGSYTLAGSILTPEAAWLANRVQAEHFVVAERFEDAAQLHEKLGMWAEAGDLRRRARRQVVTQVHVDMNALIEQLKRTGIQASYVCPICHGPRAITGDSRPDALTTCQYCGVTIRQTDLIDAITKVVGFR